MSDAVDVAVIGGGIIGASVAFHLKERAPHLRVALLEKDPFLGAGATSRATGGVRLQFATEANIRLSLMSIPYFEEFEQRFGVDPGFRRHGYLFVTADRARLPAMQAQVALQNRLGVNSALVSGLETGRLCPPLRTDDLVGGTFCRQDGSLDPHSLVQGFLARFRQAGGEVLTDAEVTGLTWSDGPDGSRTWQVRAAGRCWESGQVVVAAGPHSDQVMAKAGVEVPSKPYGRQVFVLKPHPDVPGDIPMVVDADTGWYVHAEPGGALLLGGTDKDIRPGLRHDVDWDLFDRVYDAAAHRMPVLADAEMLRAYAGVRQLTPDHHPVLGPVGGMPGLYLACGFSGHGIMHSPAVGLLLSEWVLDGRPLSWDARCLTLERFERGELLDESAVF
ncbi:MAG: FAD-dependent oxidoreductase [Thermaerobacterales bacterium]